MICEIVTCFISFAASMIFEQRIEKGRNMNQVLLCSLPRSGSTWVGKLLDTLPSTVYLHEPDSYKPIPCVPLCTSKREVNVWGSICKRYVRDIQTTSNIRTRGKLPLFRKDFDPLGLHKLNIFRLKAVSRILKNTEFTVPLPPSDISAKYTLVWKSIESVGRLPIISQSNPELKIVHLARHPCGFVNSVLKGESQKAFNKTGGIALSDDMGIFHQLCVSSHNQNYQLSLDDFLGMSKAERLAWFWRFMNEIGASVKDSNYSLLIYDQLCSEPLTILQELLDQLDLDRSAQASEFLNQSINGRGSSYFSIYKGTSSSDRWRQDLESIERDQVLNVVKNSSFFEKNFGDC